jgi:methyl coenzyme M reductase beta subunit
MTTDLYILGDADQVRDGIDKRLLQGQLQELRAFSAALTSSIAHLLRSFEDEMGAEVIMAGGDDLLVRVPAARYSVDANLALAVLFQRDTGCAISFGVGSTLSAAYINLRRAKAEKSGICFENLLI